MIVNDIRMYNDLIESKEQELIGELKRQLRLALQALHNEKEAVGKLEEELAGTEAVHQNNLNVIEELEQHNKELKEAGLRLQKERDSKQRTIRELQEKVAATTNNQADQHASVQTQIQQMRVENQRLVRELQQREKSREESRKTIESLELKHRMELEQVSQFAAQKLKNDESHHSRIINSLRSENEKAVRELKQSNELLIAENKRLMESLNSLKETSLDTESKLTDKLERLERQYKENEYCRQIYQQELENVKQTSAEWQATLREKVKIAQGEKEQALQELAEERQHRKTKTSDLKKQFAEKIEELVQEKAKAMSRYEDVARKLKSDCERLEYTNQQLRKQTQDFEKQRRQIQEEAQSRYQVYMKSAEEDKRAARNDIELKNSRIQQLTRELDQANKTTNDLKVVVQKLRFTAETRTNQYETLKLEFNKFKADARAKRQPDNLQPQPVNNGVEFSKYFSEDMGPIDDMWFERKSDVKPAPINGKPEPALRDVYEVKRLESLERENIELKEAVGKMAREMQDVRDTFSQKMDLKDRQIKLTKDQTYMLKDRLNQKEQEVFRYRDRLNQSEIEVARLQQRCRSMKQVEQQHKDTKHALDTVEHQLSRIRQEVNQLQQENEQLAEEREKLVAISVQLRAQLNHCQDQLHQQASASELSNKLLQNRRLQSEDAQVSEIGRLLEGNNLQSDVHFNTGERTKIKQPRKHSPVHQYQPNFSQQPTQSGPVPTKRPDSLMNLIKQRKSLQREEPVRQLPNLQVAAEQATLHETQKDRPYPQTQSQKDAFDRLRKRSEEKTMGDQSDRGRKQLVHNQ